jgi:diguanylate cyclase (GGDEF)-like protein/PAS domain S-box-containing protein
VVAPRSPDPAECSGPVRDLALRWASLAPTGAPGALPDRLCTLLRRLAAVLAAEPYFARGARAVGADIPATGLCGDPSDLPMTAADVLPATLRLLREEIPPALGLRRPDDDRRLWPALDELAAGFSHALAEMWRPEPAAVPPPALGGGSLLDARHLHAFYEQIGIGIVVIGLDGHVLAVNPAMRDRIGLPHGLEQPRPLSDFVHPDDLAEILERFHRIVRADPPTMRIDVRLVRADSSDVVWAHAVATLVRRDDGSPSHIAVVVEDVTARQELQARVRDASAQGQLASLPGRSLTDSWLLRKFGGEAGRVGLCSLDVDGFHAINDALGEAVGDRLLLGVAGRLQLAAGEHLVTRSGGDEFTVLVADPSGAVEVCRVADRLQGALSTPFVVDGHRLAISASVGVAEGATAGNLPSELQRAAEVARSWAKALGGGRRVLYDPARDAGEAARYTLLAGLPRAIANGEFRLAYQPLVALGSYRIRGAEALVRWQHPEQGLLGPGRFIPLAEDSGAIVDLGRWILEEACRQAARWSRELGADAPYVSVNVSPVQMAHPGWVDAVGDALLAADLPPDRLQLEITEQAVLGESAGPLDGIVALREAGVRLALDDFGTGWSSLAWLRRLPVHALKIDGSFIDGLRHPVADTVDAAIVGSLIGMAHALGLEVTAEWVETAAQAERLAALGCDLGQGRWFGDAGPGGWVPELARRSIST